MENTLNKARDALKEHIQLIVRKNGNMTPPDIEMLNKDLCALECLQRIENMCEGDYSEGNSFRRGRSQTTGRFTSHDGGNSSRCYDGETGNSGYSGHSIHDRITAQLERMMNDAQNDYERQQIREFIKKSRES